MQDLDVYKNAPKIDDNFFKIIGSEIEDPATIKAIKNFGLFYKLKDKSKSNYQITYMVKVAELKEGDEFGELALINSAPRAATIVANTPTYLAVLNKKPFNRILMNFERSKMVNQIKILSVYPVFQGQSRTVMGKLCKYIDEIPLTKGKVLFRENDPVSLFFHQT